MPLVRLPTAPLVAVYGAIPGLANKVCTLAIFMIFPDPLLIICLAVT